LDQFLFFLKKIHNDLLETIVLKSDSARGWNRAGLKKKQGKKKPGVTR
jgi:hypothetical protein